MDTLCHVRNNIMYVLSSQTVSALTRVLFLCLFPLLLCNLRNKRKNKPLVSAETVRHSSTCIILYLFTDSVYTCLCSILYLYIFFLPLWIYVVGAVWGNDFSHFIKCFTLTLFLSRILRFRNYHFVFSTKVQKLNCITLVTWLTWRYHMMSWNM